MIFRENVLEYKEYRYLRESVGWCNFSEEQSRAVLKNSLYTILALDGVDAVGMGRLIGDGMYFLIADVVVSPEYQGKKTGTEIIRRLLGYVESHTPSGSRSSVQLISEKGKEPFYEKLGFKRLPHEFCGCGMRRIIHGEGSMRFPNAE